MNKFDKAKSSDTFCILPWIHQYVGPGGDVKPCCMFQMNMNIGDFKTNTLKEIWNNNDTRQLRLDMIDGKQIAGCQKCNVREKLNSSPRKDFNTNFINQRSINIVNSTLDDGTVPVHELHYIDARFNNLCNLRCRTCGPDYSTSWMEDQHKLILAINGVEIKYNTLHSGATETQLVEEILPHLSTVTSIYFAGGEPLMQRDHYLVLQKLIDINHPGLSDSNKLRINYNTNFTNLKLGKYHVLDYWKKFPNLMINASIDGSYQRAEYWRKGTVWNKIVENRYLLLSECPNVKFKISYTISWPNVYNVFELHREWTDLKLISIDDINLNFLDSPLYYSIKSLPNWKKNNIKSYLEEYYSWAKEGGAGQLVLNQILDLIKFMYQDDHGDKFAFKKDFIDFSLKLDTIRNENFWDVFTEHSDLKHYFVQE
jgi:organic radical activating enzyme